MDLNPKKQKIYINLTCFTIIKASSEIDRNQTKRQTTLIFSIRFPLGFIGQTRVIFIKIMDNSTFMSIYEHSCLSK